MVTTESNPTDEGTPAGDTKLFGIVAEFVEAEQLMRAAEATYAAGYRRVEAYSPFPMEGLAESLGFKRTLLPMLVLGGGVMGCVGGFALQYWSSVHAYPLNIGGRPLNTWPMFIPVTFELTVLVAALFCVLGMLALNGLPRPHHPLFDVPGFERASQDRFFLVVQERDPKFEFNETAEFLESLQPIKVTHVPQRT